MPGGWAGSARKSELPADWPAIRQQVFARDKGRCRWIENNARCPQPGTDVDHKDDPADHGLKNLRLLCSEHHDRRSSAQGNAAKKAKRERNLERHPALGYPPTDGRPPAMPHTNERFAFPANDPWFDADNPGTLHDALRADYAATKAKALRRPSLRRHLESCPVCAELATTAPAELTPVARKRIKLQITAAQMKTLLQLPEHFEIVHMYAQPDPNLVTVLVAGEGLPAVDPDAETPTGAVPDDTVTGIS